MVDKEKIADKEKIEKNKDSSKNEQDNNVGKEINITNNPNATINVDCTINYNVDPSQIPELAKPKEKKFNSPYNRTNQNHAQDQNSNNRDKNKENQLILYKVFIPVVIVITLIILVFVHIQRNNVPKSKEIINNKQKKITNNIPFNLVFMYLHLRNFNKDIASFFAKEFADKGDAKAQYELGRMCELGKELRKDLNEAKEYYKEASKQGYPEADFALAKLLEKEKPEKAKELYKKAFKKFEELAKQNDIESQIYLWVIYKNGFGVEQNLDKAGAWLAKVKDRCEQLYNDDCIFTQNRLDIINKINNDGNDNQDLESDRNKANRFYRMKDFTNAQRCFESLAENNKDIESIVKLAYMIKKGWITNTNSSIDDWEKEVYQQLSEKQDVQSLVYKTIMLEYGIGTEKDSIMARKCLDSAMNNDPEKANKVLIDLDPLNFSNDIVKLRYEHLNLSDDEKEVLRKFEFYFAGTNVVDYAKAKYDLGHMYETGQGVNKNLDKAKFYYKEASKQGYPEADFALAKLLEKEEPEKAKELYKKALTRFEEFVKLGNIEFQIYILYMYAEGLGTEKNTEEFKKARDSFSQNVKSVYEYTQEYLKKQIEEEKSKNVFSSILKHIISICEYIKKCLTTQNEDYYKNSSDFYKFLMDLGDMYKNGIKVEQNSEQSDYWYKLVSEYFNWNRKNNQFKAESKNADAQYILAKMYDKGIGIEKNLEKALEWYEKSAKNGNSKAQYKLVEMNCEREVEKNFKWALEWYEKSANNGNADAQNKLADVQYKLAEMYREGVVLEKNLEKALEWYEKSFKNGNSKAQDELAKMYYKKAKKNLEKAQERYEESAKNGNADAQYKLAEIYYEGVGVEKNLEEALKWYEESAKNGNADAQYKLANFHFEKGREWCKESADAGNAEANYFLYSIIRVIDQHWANEVTEFNLKKWYEKNNFNNDLKKAKYWYEKAAEQGNIDAQFMIGSMYLIGEEYEKAFKWYEKAAKKGYDKAQYTLGIMYYKGYYVEKNRKEALYWINESIIQGNSKVKLIYGNMLWD